MKKLCIINSGCGGHYDLFRQIIKSAENEYEITIYPDEADVIIHYSCGFTEEQMAEIFKHVVFYEKVKKDGAKLIFCGCGLTGYRKELFKELKVVDHVIIGMNILPEITQIMGVTPTDNQHYESDEGVFCIKIAEGCYKPGGFCTFCKQNYLKIPYKSNYSIERICELIRSHGKPIVVLQAMNTTNYGTDYDDNKQKLHTLIKEVSKIDTVKWIQVDGVASSCIYEELISELEHNDKVCHVQFFIQSGSDHMLEEMNIGSTIAENSIVLERFKEKAVSGGVVIGHPGETMEDVMKTIQFIKYHNLWYIDVMRYKDSVMAPSGKMEKLSDEDYELHCSMVEEAVEELAYQNMRDIEDNGFMGYISELYTEKGKNMAFITPLKFVGGCYVEVDKMKVKLGDKVYIHNPKILKVSRHYFEDGTVEVKE